MNSSNPFPAPMGVEGLQNISGTCSDQDYVQVAYGILGRMVTIVNVPTNASVSLAFQLFYNSLAGPSSPGPVGYWQHNWQLNLNLSGVGTVIVATMESGRQYNFNFDSVSNTYLLDGTTSTFL